ncbi:MAG: hypothetical protein FJ264_17755 [Planctomycetes bacterium]|nr:hypothetical protein [Planctomycetota bacterium]MBM4067123.1 hypothetical protein [Planctomycetota bacterium]
MENILVFKIGATCFGIETAYVKTVTKNLEGVYAEPLSGIGVGIAGYDGQKICMFDLEKKFFGSTDIGLDACHDAEFIVVSFEGNGFAIPIDGTADIVQVSENDILPIPAFAVRYMAKNIFKGVIVLGDKLVLVLNVGRLFN